MGTKTLLTVEQFAQMATAETEDYELVEGELISLSSPTPLHAEICSRLERIVRDYFERASKGRVFRDVDCQLTHETVRRPDLAIFLAPRVQLIDLRQVPIPFAPDIAVEVLSPSESAIEVNRKVVDYLAVGAQEVWVIDHANREQFIHSEAGIRRFRGSDTVESPVLPELTFSIAKLLQL